MNSETADAFNQTGGAHIRQSGEYIFNIAESGEELGNYFRLRHAVFVEEQNIFSGTDVDERDRGAVHIIALKGPDRVMVGGVRCYTTGNDTCTASASRRLTLQERTRGSGLRFAVETVKPRDVNFSRTYSLRTSIFQEARLEACREPIEYEGVTHQLMERTWTPHKE
jgi:predicted GNAT family N-acyltransferase